MALNLIEAVQAQMTPDAVSRVAESTGEAPNRTGAAMTAGVFAIIAALVRRGSTPAGATNLLSTLQQPGGDLTSGLLGEHADQVTDTVARSSLVSRSTSSSVVRALLPIAAGVLGREVASNKLDANGLAGLLEAQKRHLAGHPMLGGIATETESAVGVRDVGVYPTAAPRRATAQPEPHKRSMWPLLLLGLLLLAAFLLLLRWQTPTTPRTSKPEIPSVEEPAGQTTMTGAEIAKPGGEDLAAHFSGKGELPDRFALPGVNFEFGTTTLTEGGEATIDALAAQMKAHPSSRLRLEGHTDSTGDQDVNAPLSYQRAGVVKNMLVERGIGANRIETKGRLANDPVAPNDTRAGRAQNRRIDAVILVR